MSTSVYPPLPPEQLIREEEASLARELDWLLSSLQETLCSLREGLRECAALLRPNEPGSTLVISSPRSDSVKGFVTREGTRIVRGDMHVKMNGLQPTKGHSSYRLILSTTNPNAVLVLSQLVDVRNLIDQSLDVVDVSTWTGDAKNGAFIAGQLRLLLENIHEAREELRGGEEYRRDWVDNPVDARSFDPALPENLSFHLSISDAALLVELRTLEPASANDSSSLSGGFGFRERIAVAIGASRRPDHDEADEVFRYRGQEVRVREKVKMESQDPSLMAVMAKLTALEHNVAAAKKSLDIVMEKDD
ncbi:MAG: hypothetical protein M1816_004040 [Peltula sp. TS41687]|nr:MAG: hypothetical protein M1816_004040 [Peltula sp. TS41687]